MLVHVSRGVRGLVEGRDGEVGVGRDGRGGGVPRWGGVEVEADQVQVPPDLGLRHVVVAFGAAAAEAPDVGGMQEVRDGEEDRGWNPRITQGEGGDVVLGGQGGAGVVGRHFVWGVGGGGGVRVGGVGGGWEGARTRM